MKIQIKKLSLALIALGLSGVASAAMYAPPAPAICTGHNVVVPCEGTGWRVGITGLYVEQSTDNPSYAAVDTFAFTDTTGAVDRNFLNVNADWNWGFKLEAAYIWRQGHELALSWKHIKGDADDTHFSIARPVFTGGLIPLSDTGVVISTPYDSDVFGVLPIAISGPITSVVNNGHFDFDQVNGEIAQYVHFGDFVNTRFNFGLSYLRLDHDVDTAFAGGITEPFGTVAGSTLTSDFAAAISDDSRFDGIGIRTGLNANWNLFRGDTFTFGVVGEANAGLYAGDIKNTVDAIITGTTTLALGSTVIDTDTGTGVFRSHYEDDRTIVPEAEAKLGLGVGYMMGDAGRLELNGGWETQGVFHAIKHFGVVSNYGHQGPYLQLQYVA